MRLCAIALLLLLAGCQTPATFYSKGVILWYNGSAIGLGYGEYAEVCAGGKLTRKTSHSGETAIKTTVIIDNSAAVTLPQK